MLSLHPKAMSHLGPVANRERLRVTADFVGFDHIPFWLSHSAEFSSVQLFLMQEQFPTFEHWSPLFDALPIKPRALGDGEWGPGQGALHQTRTRAI